MSASTTDRETNYRFLVFGGTGSIGSAIVSSAVERGWSVVSASRRGASKNDAQSVSFDPLADNPSMEALARFAPYSAVCWAQGANLNDNVYNCDPAKNLDLYKANCLYIVASLKMLLDSQLLKKAAKLCVISSIWQDHARPDKLSYCMTKAALQGLVLSASTDLAVDGHLINAVLPGAIESPMTSAQLKPEQIANLRSATKFGRLPSQADVSAAVLFLCSEQNTGITGQFVTVDLGFNRVHLI